jgi:hypothetical protein
MSAPVETPAVLMTTRISIRESDTWADIEIGDPRLQDPIQLSGASDWETVTQLGQLAADRLDKAFRLHRVGLTLTPTVRDQLLEKMRAIGMTIWIKVLGYYRSQDLLVLGTGTLDQTALLSLELDCPNNLVLPVELLPILEPAAGTQDGGAQRAAALIGFGAQATRSITVRGMPPTESSLDPTMMRFYWDARLDGAKHELEALAARFGNGLLGPNPWSRKVTRDELVRQVIEAPLRTGSAARPAIEHFSCHHVRAASSRDQDVIWLRSRGWRAKRIPLRADDLTLVSVSRPAKPGLVFLNACGTQTTLPRAVSSIVREFHECGRSAIVTTWCDVPDLVAAKMSDYFYRALYAAGGMTVGEALRAARLRLLNEHNNPLGLLYTVYGDADYRVVG